MIITEEIVKKKMKRTAVDQSNLFKKFLVINYYSKYIDIPRIN